MDIAEFTGHPEVLDAIARIRTNVVDAGRIVSDIVDDDGHQYVDLVTEGGGVLGIALVGYTYALESAGIRFLGVGGTSAGAINATMVAGLAPPAEAKSERILAILSELRMFEFVDGDSDAVDFVRALVEKAGPMKLAWKGLQVVDNMNEDLGLNPGREFRRWVKHRLREAGVKTVGDLEARMHKLPASLRLRDGTPLSREDAAPRLAIIAADISTETRVEFPRMACLYWDRPEEVNPARMVRASMSIPAFFHPVRIDDIPQGEEARRRWKDLAGYDGALPEEVLLVDGGIVSNFPIDVFHAPGVPTAPTFGVKLGSDRNAPREVRKPGALLGAIFDSARHVLDYEFVRRNPDYRRLVARIETDAHDWLNFFMEDEEKVQLFEKGVVAAERFLASFDWEDYKDLRARLAGAG